MHLRSDIFFRVRIIQLVVVIRLLGDLVIVLGEHPFQRACAVAEPQYFTAACIAGVQRAVVVHCIDVIFLCILVPQTSINNDPLTAARL